MSHITNVRMKIKDLGAMEVAGQAVGFTRDIPTVKELVDRIVGDAERAIKRMGGMVG